MGPQCVLLFTWANILYFLSVANAWSFSEPAIADKPFPIKLNGACNGDSIWITDDTDHGAFFNHFFFVRGMKNLKNCLRLSSSYSPKRKLDVYSISTCFNGNTIGSYEILISRSNPIALPITKNSQANTYVYTVNCRTKTHQLETISNVISYVSSFNGTSPSLRSPIRVGNTFHEFDLILDDEQFKDVGNYAYIKECKVLIDGTNETDIYKNCQLLRYKYQLAMNTLRAPPLYKIENGKKIIHFNMNSYTAVDFSSDVKITCTLNACSSSDCRDPSCSLVPAPARRNSPPGSGRQNRRRSQAQPEKK